MKSPSKKPCVLRKRAWRARSSASPSAPPRRRTPCGPAWPWAPRARSCSPTMETSSRWRWPRRLPRWPRGPFASKIEVNAADVVVTREVDGGHQTVRLQLPAIVTADLRLNQPRYASLPNIMKAKRAPLERKPLAGLGLDTGVRLEVLKMAEPPHRKAGVKVSSVAELVSKLKTEAGVLQ